MAEVTEAAQARAEELEVDLSGIEGSGVDGRVLVEDVEAAASANQVEAEPEEKEVYVFNKATGLVGFTFGDGKKFKTGVRYALDSEGVEKYAKTRHNGHQMLVKE